MRTSAEMFTLFEKITHSSDKIRVMTLEVVELIPMLCLIYGKIMILPF